MPCCLTAPRHYLDQYWLIIKEVGCHSPRGQLCRKCSQDAYPWYEYKNEWFKIQAHLTGAYELRKLAVHHHCTCCVYCGPQEAVIIHPVEPLWKNHYWHVDVFEALRRNQIDGALNQVNNAWVISWYWYLDNLFLSTGLAQDCGNSSTLLWCHD